MKKFYAFAAAALLATAANAQTLYICGNGDGLAWDPFNPAQMTYENGEFTYECTNLVSFKLSTNSGDWDAENGFNSGVLGCSYGDQPGVAVPLEQGFSNNIDTPWTGDYKIVVSGDMSTITLFTETPNPGPQAPVLYLRGDMNGWNADEAWQLEALSNTILKFTCAEDQQIAAGESFKIADASWGKLNYGAGDESVTMIGVETPIFNGSNNNMSVEEAFNGVLWVNLDIDGEAYFILDNDKEFVPEWEGIDPNAVNTIEISNEAPVYFNLQGVRVANPANGIYVKVLNGKATKAVIK